MNVAKNVFLRIISKVHQKVSSDNEDNYDEDSTKMLFPRNKDTLELLSQAAESASVLYIRKKLINFMIVYDSVAFCIRFDKECTFKDVNMRLLASSLDDLPSSSGKPRFLYQTTEETTGWGLNVSDYDDNGSPVEIFPVCDFEHVCFYTARIPGQYSTNSSISQSSAPMQSSLSTSQSIQSSVSNKANLTQCLNSLQHDKSTTTEDDELQVSRSLMQSKKSPIQITIRSKAFSQRKPSQIKIVKEKETKENLNYVENDEQQKENSTDSDNNNEEEESDFILGQRPNQTESSSDEFISQENEELRNALLQQRQLVHLQEENEEHEEEEEQFFEQYIGPTNSNSQNIIDQQTPPGFFAKYLSSSDSSSFPSSIFDEGNHSKQ